jgi:hypothetical protein
MAMSNCTRSWGAMTCARAAPGAGFKRCCLAGGRYDGSPRNHFFQGEEMKAGSSSGLAEPSPHRSRVIPALVAGIQLSMAREQADGWIPGTRPGMTAAAFAVAGAEGLA